MQAPTEGQSTKEKHLQAIGSVDASQVVIIDTGANVDFLDAHRKGCYQQESAESLFPFGRSYSAEQICLCVKQHGWNSICNQLSGHLGGQYSAKPITLCAQPAEMTFVVDTNTDSTTDEADLMDIPIKVKQQLTFSDNEHTTGNLH